MDLRLGWDLGLILSPMCLSLSLSTATHQTKRVGRTAGAGQTSFGVCMQCSKIANRARWTRSLRVSVCGVGGAVLVEAEVDRWHALCSMRSVLFWNDFD